MTKVQESAKAILKLLPGVDCGGFGGCTVSIVKDEAIENFEKIVGENYKKKIGYDATFYTVEIGGGPEVI